MSKSIEHSYEKITPEIANNYLIHNQTNRRLQKRAIEKYSDAMLRGEWQLNGQAILFDEKGKLLDGQHRLHAIIKSNVTIDSLVIRNIKNIAFETLDIGMKRNNPDFLYLQGKKYTTVLSIALSTIYNYKKGNFFDNGGEFAPSPTEMMELLEENPGIEYSVKFCVGRYKPLQSAGISASCHYLFSKNGNQDACEEFFNKFYSGNDLPNGSPILALRTRLLLLRGSRPRKRHLFAFMIKAWNFYLQNESCNIIKWTTDMEFPKIL